MTHGATMVYPAEAFEPKAVLQTIQEERCTALYGVPTMFIAELADPDFATYDLSSLRTGVMAGSPCPVEVMRQVMARQMSTDRRSDHLHRWHDRDIYAGVQRLDPQRGGATPIGQQRRDRHGLSQYANRAGGSEDQCLLHERERGERARQRKASHCRQWSVASHRRRREGHSVQRHRDER